MTETGAAILDSYRPKIIPLESNLSAAVFPFMKVFPAEFCVRHAREEGLLGPHTLVVETSSGNMALGLAIVCRLYRHHLTIVSDCACDGFLRRRLEDLGVRVEIVSAPMTRGGYQQARLNKLAEIRDKNPGHWWLNQYDNPGNPGAYSFLAGLLVESLGRIDCLVGTVGSGGSMCGTSTFLRELFPNMVTIGVDTFGSVLFGQPDQPRKLRGLGNSVMPGNLDHSCFDEVHWVSAAEAYTATRILHRETSLFCGGTSGAAWMVARYWARQHPEARVACLFPDDGYRYADTIYNDGYLVPEGLWLTELPELPRMVNEPSCAGPTWSSMQWQRRKFGEVINLMTSGTHV